MFRSFEFIKTLLSEETTFGRLKLKKLKNESKMVKGTYSPNGTNFCLSNLPFNFPKDIKELLTPSSLLLFDKIPKIEAKLDSEI